MTLKEYITDLQKICKKNPDLEVIYSTDDEGNGYGRVFYSPTLGYFENGEFTSEENSEENDSYKLNAVVIN